MDDADNVIEIKRHANSVFRLVFLRAKFVKLCNDFGEALCFADGLRLGIEDGDCSAEIIVRGM